MSYKNLKDNARVWVFQANRPLLEKEIQSIREQGQEFILKWSAHGAKLDAAFEVFHNQFIVLFVDEEQAKASGCSIDKSIRFIKQLEMEFDISLLDRNLVAYKDSGRIIIISREVFVERIRNGVLNENTIVFNTLVSTKKEFLTGWETPLKSSWHYDLAK
ncbi:MAG: ABC transporter ATPase [Candidatus Zixiibacteriota bacterium]